jgi:hypothetical protein
MVSAKEIPVMKKTIWLPLGLGTAFGLLAGITTATGFIFIVPGASDTENAVGVIITIFLLAAALGGPLAGVICTTLWVIISAQFGPPDIKSIISIPEIFWAHIFEFGLLVALVGFAYRWIFERFKMPARLLAWSGVVILFYLINPPIMLSLQDYMLGGIDILPATLSNYRIYLPQAIFDIIFTSLVFVALPARYRKPLWY